MSRLPAASEILSIIWPFLKKYFQPITDERRISPTSATQSKLLKDVFHNQRWKKNNK